MDEEELTLGRDQHRGSRGRASSHRRTDQNRKREHVLDWLSCNVLPDKVR